MQSKIKIEIDPPLPRPMTEKWQASPFREGLVFKAPDILKKVM